MPKFEMSISKMHIFKTQGALPMVNIISKYILIHVSDVMN